MVKGDALAIQVLGERVLLVQLPQGRRRGLVVQGLALSDQVRRKLEYLILAHLRAGRDTLRLGRFLAQHSGGSGQALGRRAGLAAAEQAQGQRCGAASGSKTKKQPRRFLSFFHGRATSFSGV